VKAGRFLCTHEYPSKNAPWPIVFTVDASGVSLDDQRVKQAAPAELATVIAAARGGSQPPLVQIGFGAS